MTRIGQLMEKARSPLYKALYPEEGGPRRKPNACLQISGPNA
jgi:hypothetical protein